MSMKKAAEELLKIADEMEQEASKVTQFVCEGCNHTATLETINSKRKEAAEAAQENGMNVNLGTISVNDKVACPACGESMSYKASEESEKFYFDPEKKEAGKKSEEEEEEEEEKEEMEEEKKASEPIDYDSLERYSS